MAQRRPQVQEYDAVRRADPSLCRPEFALYPGSVHVAMWSTKYWDIEARQSMRYNLTSPDTRHLSGPECVPNEGYGGFDIDVERLFYRSSSSKLHHRETMHTTYAPSDTVICL
jgi:hypothetical protein